MEKNLSFFKDSIKEDSFAVVRNTRFGKSGGRAGGVIGVIDTTEKAARALAFGWHVKMRQ
jgi:hypothetical protein